MKKLKKILAMMISMVMVLSMATVGFATTGGTGSLTVQLTGENKLDSGKSHTVKLYKLLNIDSYSGDKYSYSLNGDYTEAIKTALNNGSMKDEDIITEIGKINGSSNPTTQEFANALEKNYTGAADKEAKIESGNNSVEITGLDAGYYLIVLDNAKAIQANLKNVVNGDNGRITLKEEAPSIEKVADKTDVEIGEIVTYTITTTIPKKLSDTMVYKITDILSEGLDFVDFDSEDTPKNTQSLVIETKLDNQDTTGITASVEGRTMTIDLAEYIKGHQSDIGKTLTIKYKAKVNKNAVVTEKNSAKLEYGKDTNNTIVNKPEEVKTPTFPVHINKVDEKQTELAGAEFELYPDNGGSAGTTAIKVSGSDGIYKIDPASGETKMTTATITGTQFGKEGGYNLVINGLKAGTYWLKETKAPDGYNLLKNDIKITVTNNNDGKYTISTDQKDGITVADNIVTIVNKSSSALPETGGTGTLLLTAVGALLVAVAMIRFMRRKQEN